MKVKRIIGNRIVYAASINDAINIIADIVFKKYGKEMLEYEKEEEGYELSSEAVHDWFGLEEWWDKLAEKISERVVELLKAEREK